MKIVIIGYGPAAVSALRAIEHSRHLIDGTFEVTVVSSEPMNAYAPMFLIDYSIGKLAEEQLYLLKGNQAHGLRAEIILGKQVNQVVEQKKYILLEDGREIKFDRLLIATGASAISPPIKGLSRDGVFFLNRLKDAEKLSRALKKASNILIVGAGAIGLEAAIAFNKLGKGVKVIELKEQILPQILSQDLAQYVQRKLEGSGIEFLLGETISQITGRDKVVGVVTRTGKEICGDLILIAAGVRPNIGLLGSSCIKTNSGIIVDEYMRTNVPYIYAAGDVAETKNLDGEFEVAFSWYKAVAQGWVAGLNLIGQPKKYSYIPVLSVIKGADFPIISIGSRPEQNYELVSYRNEEGGILEEVYIKDGYIEHYEAIGLDHKVGFIYWFIKDRKRVEKFKESLLSPNFSATKLMSL